MSPAARPQPLPPPPVERLDADAIRCVLDAVDDPRSLARLLCAARSSAAPSPPSSSSSSSPTPPPPLLLLSEAACERRWRLLFAQRWGEPGTLAERAAATTAVGGFRRLYSERAEAERLSRAHAAVRQEAGVHEDEDARADQDELEAWLAARRRVAAQAAQAAAVAAAAEAAAAAAAATTTPAGQQPPPRSADEQQQQLEEQRLRQAFLASRRACTAGCASEVAALLEAIAEVPALPVPLLQAPPSSSSSSSTTTTTATLPPILTTLRAVFLVDGSGSVTKREFDRARAFLQAAIDAVERRVAEAAPPPPAPLLAAEVSVVQFSSTATIEGTAAVVAGGGSGGGSSSSASSSKKASSSAGELRLASRGVAALRSRLRKMHRLAGGTNVEEGLRLARAIFDRAPALDEAALSSANLKAEECGRALHEAKRKRDAAAVAFGEAFGAEAEEGNKGEEEEAAADAAEVAAAAALAEAKQQRQDVELALRNRLSQEEAALAARHNDLVDACATAAASAASAASWWYHGLLSAYQLDVHEQRKLEAGLVAAQGRETEAAAEAERAAIKPRLLKAERAMSAAQAAADAASEEQRQARVRADAARTAVARRVFVLLTDGRVGEHEVYMAEAGVRGLAGQGAGRWGSSGGGGGGGGGGSGGGSGSGSGSGQAAPLEAFVVGFSSRFDPHLLAPVAEVASGSAAAAGMAPRDDGGGDDGEEEEELLLATPRLGVEVPRGVAASPTTPSYGLSRASSLPSPSGAALPRCVRLLYPPLEEPAAAPAPAPE
jgi:hypothetical protein